MSFFRKLKERLTGSSSKLDEAITELIDAGEAQDHTQTEDLSDTPAPPPQEAPPEQPTAQAPNLMQRLLGQRHATPKESKKRIFDDELLEDLEELLIASDMGVETALRVGANLARDWMGKRVGVDEIKAALAQQVADIMANVAKPIPLYNQTPQVVLVVGVNGAGKTTTIGKLAKPNLLRLV